MDPRSRFAASDTTYHSFHDIELFEPPSPPRHKTSTSIFSSDGGRVSDERPPTAAKMLRQDSGYESYPPTPRTSTSGARPSVARRVSTASSAGGRSSRPRTRPSTRRSAKSYSHPQSYSGAAKTSSPPLHLQRPDASQLARPATTYYHFPSPPDPSEVSVGGAASSAAQAPAESQAPAEADLPQTTHYWTSDSTRRLEYAAIDAASRGVKGWIRRNLVPDCLVPKGERHVAFDDDSGSVRRYRLELAEDEAEEGVGHEKEGGRAGRQRRGWQFWGPRKGSV